MNEYMQEFMLTHDFHIMNVQEGPNPDNMSYEVALKDIFSNFWSSAIVLVRFPKEYQRRNSKSCQERKISPAIIGKLIFKIAVPSAARNSRETKSQWP